MKPIALSSVFFAIAASSAALADPGHVAESGGHSHWLSLGALALAVVIAGRLALGVARRAAARSRNG